MYRVHTYRKCSSDTSLKSISTQGVNYVISTCPHYIFFSLHSRRLCLSCAFRILPQNTQAPATHATFSYVCPATCPCISLQRVSLFFRTEIVYSFASWVFVASRKEHFTVLTNCIIFLPGSHISLYPSLNFVVYVPSQTQTPLYMKNKDGKT